MKDQPAFPEVHGYQMDATPGLTKLEWYAGMALQGILAHRDIDPTCDLSGSDLASVEKHARYAFTHAEAMCAEAGKRKVQEEKP